jgi:hypothetical protein
MGSLIEVRVRDCACPDAPHPDGDIVYLRPKIGLEGGIAAQQALAKADGDVEVLTRLWLSLFVRYGATGWNLRDEGGAVPFDVDALLADYALSWAVAEKAEELYGDDVMRPLLNRPSTTSQAGPTVVSTSATNTSTRSPRRRSSPPASVASTPSSE